MEKDKMVEELEAILEQEQIKIANKVEEFTKLQKVGITRCNAEAMYNANCRVIHEGEVVLTKSEAQHYYAFKLIEPEIRGCMDRERELIKKLEQVRDETKREVLKKLNGFRFFMYDEDDEGEECEIASWCCGEEDVKQFAKEIGVVVKE